MHVLELRVGLLRRPRLVYRATYPRCKIQRPAGRGGGGFVEVQLPKAEDWDAAGTWRLEAIADVIVLPRVKTPNMTAYKVDLTSR
jgi:hypothetical protein